MRWLWLIVLVGLVLAAAGGAAWAVSRRVSAPYQGYAGPEQFVDLPPGTPSRAIGRRLVDRGIIRDSLTFRVALWRSGSARQLKAGEYRFDRPMTPREVIERIARGDVFLRPLTFPEGLTIREMAQIFEARGFGTAASFAAAARNAALVADLDARATDLEGYLFPETYSLTRHASAEHLVAMMVARFRAVFDGALAREAASQGLSARQAVTLASMVEKETAKPGERPVVAAVYLRRLGIRMGLQSDPTVIYALERAGRYRGNLTKDNLTFDSPYNTYRHAGLPPGPIAAPGRASLEAVARPAAADYLYFVSRNDGSHVFSRSLAEHNRNVQRYQVQVFRGSQSRDPRANPAGRPPAPRRPPTFTR